MIKSIKYTVTTPVISEAIKMYQSGIAIRPICKQLHVDGTTLRNLLIQEGLLRTRAEAVRGGKSDAVIKDNILDLLTPEVLYWIGFIYADGNMEKPPRCRISVTLAEKDKSHVEKFANFFGTDIPIKEVTEKDKRNHPAPGQKNFDYKYFRASFSSQKIYNKLLEFGLTHRKTYNLIPHEVLKNSRDFFRGVVDGDGWACFSNEKRYGGKYDTGEIGLSGTKDTLISFLEFVKLSGIVTATTPYKDKRANVWKMSIHSKPAQLILNLLYKGSTVYLNRKYEKYLQIVNPTN